MSRSTRRPALLMALPAAATVAVLLAACSSGGDTAPESTASADSAQGQEQPGQGEMPGGGGTTGEIAAVGDALMQVQGDDGQTAVSWDDSTTITDTVAGALSDLTTGVCVTAAVGDDDVATSVTITAAVDGECTSGVGGGGGMPDMANGAAPDDMPTDGDFSGEMPDDMPSDMPSDMAGGGMGGSGNAVSGLVTAVDGSTITVEGMSLPTSDDTADSVDSGSTTSTLTVGDATTYTTTVTSDESAIVVGRCVVAQGESDDSGQVAATSLVLSDATDGSCSTGFGGGGMGGGSRPDDSGESADA